MEHGTTETAAVGALCTDWPSTWLEISSVHPSPLLSTTPFRTKHNEICFPLDSNGKIYNYN